MLGDAAENIGTENEPLGTKQLSTVGLENNFDYLPPSPNHYDRYEVTYYDGDTKSSYLVSSVKDVLALQDTLILYAKQEIAKRGYYKQKGADEESADAIADAAKDAADALNEGEGETEGEKKKDKGLRLSAGAFLMIDDLYDDSIEIVYLSGTSSHDMYTCDAGVYQQLASLSKTEPITPIETVKQVCGCSNPYLKPGVDNGATLAIVDGVKLLDANLSCNTTVIRYGMDGNGAFTEWVHNDDDGIKLTNAYDWSYFAKEINGEAREVYDRLHSCRKASSFGNGPLTGDVITEVSFAEYGYNTKAGADTLAVVWNDSAGCYQVTFGNQDGDAYDDNATYISRNKYPDAFHLEWSDEAHAYVYQRITCHGHRSPGSKASSELDTTEGYTYGALSLGTRTILEDQWVCGGHIDLKTEVHVHRLDGDLMDIVVKEYDSALEESVKRTRPYIGGTYGKEHQASLSLIEDMQKEACIWEEGSWAKIAETKAETYYSGAYEKMDSYEFTFNGEKHKMDDIKSGEQKDIEVVVETEDETGEKKKEYKTISLKVQ